MKSTLLILGECMLELSGDPADGSLRSSFAGDCCNAAIYARRWSGQLAVYFATAVGEDSVSDAMLADWREEGLDCSTVLRTPKAVPGAYLIHTDDTGERSFIYWRANSAATLWPQLLRESGGIDSLPAASYVFFSGVSLGILAAEDRRWLLDALASLRDGGAKIAFDPNYRSALWRDVAEAADWLTQAYRVCDIALPGLDDHLNVFGHRGLEEVYVALGDLGVGEVVVKCGLEGVFASHAGSELVHLPFEPAPIQVDSTSAGDSFAGTYLASRLAGADLGEALQAACDVSRLVVQHPGAIVPMDTYRQHFS
ncbi:MAG: 2-dehydro-3-deoxygluconokinase [Halieaceae bacterium]|jgi:2-dehydro-3-deoxygluconokinase